jgi:hypothetical protein
LERSGLVAELAGHAERPATIDGRRDAQNVAGECFAGERRLRVARLPGLEDSELTFRHIEHGLKRSIPTMRNRFWLTGQVADLTEAGITPLTGARCAYASFARRLCGFRVCMSKLAWSYCA